MPMKIYLDAMGGDHAPQAPAQAAREALGLYPKLSIELAGPMDEVQKAVDEAFARNSRSFWRFFSFMRRFWNQILT